MSPAEHSCEGRVKGHTIGGGWEGSKVTLVGVGMGQRSHIGGGWEGSKITIWVGLGIVKGRMQ